MRVIVTRPEREAQQWVRDLSALGLDAQALPLIKVAPVADTADLLRAWQHLAQYAGAMFVSGKHYLPSILLTQGRTDYGTNKNFIVIRYAEVLLMHAEALTRGATGSGMTADEAVNAVRTRAGLAPLTGVTAQQVQDKKFAELAQEWGNRDYDNGRT